MKWDIVPDPKLRLVPAENSRNPRQKSYELHPLLSFLAKEGKGRFNRSVFLNVLTLDILNYVLRLQLSHFAVYCEAPVSSDVLWDLSTSVTHWHHFKSLLPIRNPEDQWRSWKTYCHLTSSKLCQATGRLSEIKCSFRQHRRNSLIDACISSPLSPFKYSWSDQIYKPKSWVNY